LVIQVNIDCSLLNAVFLSNIALEWLQKPYYNLVIAEKQCLQGWNDGGMAPETA